MRAKTLKLRLLILLTIIAVPTVIIAFLMPPSPHIAGVDWDALKAFTQSAAYVVVVSILTLLANMFKVLDFVRSFFKTSSVAPSSTKSVNTTLGPGSQGNIIVTGGQNVTIHTGVPSAPAPAISASGSNDSPKPSHQPTAEQHVVVPEWERRPIQEWKHCPPNYYPIRLEETLSLHTQYQGFGFPATKPLLGRENVPFLLRFAPNGGIRGIEVWPQHPVANVIVDILNVVSIYFLVTAGNGWRSMEERQIGYLKIFFETGDPKPVSLVLGKHIREWSYKDTTNEGVVHTVTDPKVEQVWRSEDDQVTLDMLRVGIDDTLRRVTKVQVVGQCEDIPPNFKGDPPHIRVTGLTFLTLPRPWAHKKL